MKKGAEAHSDSARRNNVLVGQTSDRKTNDKEFTVPIYEGYVQLPEIVEKPEAPRYQHVISVTGLYDMDKGEFEILYFFGYADLKRSLAANAGKAKEGGLERLKVKEFAFHRFDEGCSILPVVYNFSNFYNKERELMYREVKCTTAYREAGEYFFDSKKIHLDLDEEVEMVGIVRKTTSPWAVDAINKFLSCEYFRLKEGAEIGGIKEEKIEKKKEKEKVVVKEEKQVEEEAKPINRNSRKFDIPTLRAASGALKAAGYPIHLIFNTKTNTIDVVKNIPRKGDPCVTNLGEVFNELKQA